MLLTNGQVLDLDAGAFRALDVRLYGGRFTETGRGWTPAAGRRST